MATVKTRITIGSKMTAVSTYPTQSPKTYPLSVLDHVMAEHTLHMIFYYRHSPWEPYNMNAVRESLSDVLTRYPLITGRLQRNSDGNWEVKCDDGGLRLVEATVNATLGEWLSTADSSGERDLTAWQEMPDDPSMWSPFYIQVNHFRGGGLAIGLSCTHMRADFTCATIFFKSVSESHRRTTLTHPPFHHPTAFHPQTLPNSTITTKIAAYYDSKSKAHPPVTAMSTATFRFSHETVNKCLSELSRQCPNATPFDLLASLFWSSICHLESPGKDEKMSISLCIDFRRLMHAPLPYGYFGNAVYFSELSCVATDMEKGGPSYLTSLIHDHLSNLHERDFCSAIRWFESKKEDGLKYPPSFRMYGPELTFVNMEHMIMKPGPSWSSQSATCHSLIYAATFQNDERPVHVSYCVGNVDGEGLILVLPSPEEGLGRTVTVTLPEDLTRRLCKDPNILRLEPQMLLTQYNDQ